MKLCVLRALLLFCYIYVGDKPQIDWEDSKTEGRICVRRHVDPELDEWKHVYNGLSSVLVRAY